MGTTKGSRGISLGEQGGGYYEPRTMTLIHDDLCTVVTPSTCWSMWPIIMRYGYDMHLYGFLYTCLVQMCRVLLDLLSAIRQSLVVLIALFWGNRPMFTPTIAHVGTYTHTNMVHSLWHQYLLITHFNLSCAKMDMIGLMP